MPTIAVLYREKGCRFVTLLSHLGGASRDTLSETLADLIAAGVVIRNPGYGHPLRPEYVLTPLGMAVGEACIEMVKAVSERELVEIALKKWPMLVATAIGRGAQRHHELMSALPGITPRSLSAALKDLQAEGLITRIVGAEYPPRTRYRLTEAGESLFVPLNVLVTAAERADAARAGE
ncbi:hypothetical protein AYO38_04635 [bacterium SCGC AG-212-C10]|nr:hypothetical protein AYO38_04635 [bacterium SCGC AG-212-C10]